MNNNSIYQSVAEGIMAVDSKGKIVFLNTMAEKIFGLNSDHAIGRKIAECFSSKEENDDFLNAVIDAVFSKEEAIKREVSFVSDTRKYILYMSSVYVSNSYFTGIIIVFSDITELADMTALENDLEKTQQLNIQLAKQNEILGKAFENYMDDTVVDELLFSNASASSNMKRTDLTILMIMSPAIQALITRLAPDDYMRMLNHYMDIVISKIKECKGTIIELHSDCIVAVFGAPSALKDREDSALNAARLVQQSIPEINEWNELHSYPEISLKIGLHTDEMLVGILGSAGASKYNVFGRALNIAARMAITANDGDIVLSDRTKSALKGEYDFYEDYQVVPKGLDKPITIHRVR